jgi:hypothetical protein
MVEVGLVDHFSEMIHQLPDLAQHHHLFHLVPPDLLALLGELPRHRLHLGGQLCFLILQCLHLGLIHLFGQFPKNVFDTAISQCPADSPSDMLQPLVLIMEGG